MSALIFEGFCDDKAFADKRLNCEYSGPPKSATEDQLQILQQICPHLVAEVTLGHNFEMSPRNQITEVVLMRITISKAIFGIPPQHELSLFTKKGEKDEETFCRLKPTVSAAAIPN